MLRKITFLSIFAIGAATSVVQAGSCGNANDCCGCFDGAYAGVEWLYLRAYGADLAFGRTINTLEFTGNGDRKTMIKWERLKVHLLSSKASSPFFLSARMK